MKNITLFLFPALVFQLLAACSSLPPVEYSRPGIEPLGPRDLPPRAAAFLAEMAALPSDEARQARLQDWAAQLPGGGLPLVEEGVLTFFYWAPDPTRPIAVTGDFNGNSIHDRLHALRGSRLRYKAYRGLADQDFLYGFFTDPQSWTSRVPDPLGRDLLPVRPLQSRHRARPAEHGQIVRSPILEAPAPSQGRPLDIYLPPGFGNDSQSRYPVLYFMEGLFAWDHSSLVHGGYRLDSTLDRLINSGQLPPIMAVAVPQDRNNRGGEYMGYAAWYGLEVPPDQQSRAQELRDLNDSFRRYLVDVIKPWVDGHYPTRPEARHTAIVGGSLGGGIALTMAVLHPESFGRAAALAPGQFPPPGLWEQRPWQSATWHNDQWNNNPFRHFSWLVEQTTQGLAQNRPGLRSVQLWIDSGTEGIDELFLPFLQDLARDLVSAGLEPEQNVLWRLYEGTDHTEAAWAERLPDVLQALFLGSTSPESP